MESVVVGATSVSMSESADTAPVAPGVAIATTTVVVPPGYRAARNGGWLRHGGGNPKRNGGHPTDAWKAACRDLASRPEMLARARKVLANEDHPAWLGAWRFLAEHGFGKPEQSVEVRTPEPLTIRVVDESGRDR